MYHYYIFPGLNLRISHVISYVIGWEFSAACFRGRMASIVQSTQVTVLRASRHSHSKNFDAVCLVFILSFIAGVIIMSSCYSSSDILCILRLAISFEYGYSF